MSLSESIQQTQNWASTSDTNSSPSPALAPSDQSLPERDVDESNLPTVTRVKSINWDAKKNLNAVIALRDTVYRALLEERKLGWQSENVSQAWSQRLINFNQLKETQLTSTGYRKYLIAYRNLFSEFRDFTCQKGAGKTFLDVGCAPGGLSAYLICDLKWTGAGFSLDPHSDGFAMNFSHPSLKFALADVTKADAYETISSQLDKWEFESFDFINLGVVISMHQIPCKMQVPLLNLRATRNQFLILMRWLRAGGSAMWVFSAAKVDRWFYFLGKLQALFVEPIRLRSTGAPSRSQVYALCRNYRGKSFVRDALFEQLYAATAISDAESALWCASCWSEISDTYDRLQSDLRAIWETQRRALEKIREGAEAGQSVDKQLSVIPVSRDWRMNRTDLDRDWRAGSTSGAAVDTGPSARWQRNARNNARNSTGNDGPLPRWRGFTRESASRADLDRDWRAHPRDGQSCTKQAK